MRIERYTLLVCGLLFGLCNSAFAADEARPLVASMDDISAIVEKHFSQLEHLYLENHRLPELSGAEVETADRLAQPLKELGCEVTQHIGGEGVVAVLKNGPGKTLLIRTDLDALPVREQTGASYASAAKGKDAAGKDLDVMHACGHDIHMATIVGVAQTMSALKERWRGTLVLIGQPAEETVAGARAMLKDGLYSRFPVPDWCLALHVDSELPSGTVGWTSGYAMANVDSVDIRVRGLGGHGAHPEKTKDPIVLAAQNVLSLQTIASRENTPTDPIVVTVGSIHGGTKRNIIPDEVLLQLTVRTYKSEVRERTLKSIERIAKGTALAAGVPEVLAPVVTVTGESSPALYNTPQLVERTTGVFRQLLGEGKVLKQEPAMVAEDFGIFGRTDEKVPVFMYRLGSVSQDRIAESKKPGGAPLPALHSSQYLPEYGPTIRTGVVTMTAAALDLLRK